MRHAPDGHGAVSRVTAGRRRRGHQFRFDGVLAHQSREDTAHRNPTLVAQPDTTFRAAALRVPVARYGCLVTDAIPIGRISAFVRWVAPPPWPVFTLGMVQADIIGALFVLGFLRFGLPSDDRVQLQDLPAFNLAIFLGYLFVSFTVAAWLTLRLLLPVIRWQRRDSLLADGDPTI